MSMLHGLDAAEIDQVIREGVQRNIPAAVSIRVDGRWLSLRSRLISAGQQHVLIEIPWSEEGGGPVCEFTPATKIGLNFKLKHHKHICIVTVAGIEQYPLDDGTTAPVLGVCWPTHMERLQRRMFERVDVPRNALVRVSFWLGGNPSQTEGKNPAGPTWSGLATNLSAGGVQVKCDPEVAHLMDAGDVVGMRLQFGAGVETAYCDAQFRHLEGVDGETCLGFQFLGLGQSREGQESLRTITNWVTRFQRAADRQPHWQQ